MHTLDCIIVILFLAITLLLGLKLRESGQSSSDYLLGGRALTLPAFVATTVSTWYGGILGVGEYSWLYGISNWIVFGVPYYLGALLFALLMSKRARESNAMTIPNRFLKIYGPKTAKCAAVLVFLTTVPAAYVLITATLCTSSFGFSLQSGVIATVIFVVIYLWRGGFKAVVKTDALQFALMFGGFILLTLWLLIGYGLEPLKSLPPTHLEPTGGQPLSSILIWYVIALSTLAEPNFFQRAFAAKTPKIAQNGLLISIACWAFFDVMTTLCGLYARALLPDLQNPVQAFPELAIAVLPTGIIGIFYASLFATVLSTLDSNLFTCATTLGHDLWPAKSHLSDAQKTRVGLILGAVIAAIIAVMSGSVVKIWKIFGSVSAAALLIPIVASHYPRWQMTGRGAFILMILSSCTTLGWFIAAQVLETPPCNLDPLFAGAIVAIACYLVDRIYSKKIKSSLIG